MASGVEAHQRTHVNTTCKLLLLTHAFETVGCKVVGLRTDNFNFRSQQAIEALGAKKDGVLRHYALRRNGTVRDMAMVQHSGARMARRAAASRTAAAAPLNGRQPMRITHVVVACSFGRRNSLLGGCRAGDGAGAAVRVGRSDHQPDPRSARRRARSTCTQPGARVSRSHRGVRRQGPDPARHHQHQPAGAGAREGDGSIALGLHVPFAAALRAGHPEGQLRHRRHADDRRFADAGQIGALRGRVCRQAIAGGRAR